MAIEKFSDEELMRMGMYSNLPPKKIQRVPGPEGRVVGTLREYTSGDDGVDKEALKKSEDSEKRLDKMESKIDKLLEALTKDNEDK